MKNKSTSLQHTVHSTDALHIAMYNDKLAAFLRRIVSFGSQVQKMFLMHKFHYTMTCVRHERLCSQKLETISVTPFKDGSRTWTSGPLHFCNENKWLSAEPIWAEWPYSQGSQTVHDINDWMMEAQNFCCHPSNCAAVTDNGPTVH